MFQSMFYDLIVIFALNWIPLLEGRFAIPYGILVLEVSPYTVVITSILADWTLSATLLHLLPISALLMDRYCPPLAQLKNWVLERTRKKFYQKLSTTGDVALITLVALPLPGSGVFTGSLVAYLFGIPFKKAWTLIGIGATISLILIGILTVTGQSLWEFFY